MPAWFVSGTGTARRTDRIRIKGLSLRPAWPLLRGGTFRDMRVTQALSLKTQLRTAAPLYGFFVGIPSPAVVEMVGCAGFDFAILDCEHGPTGIETLENMVRAAEAVGLASIVRVPEASAAAIMAAVETGADAIMVPHVASAAAARRVVDHACYPPLGRRGMNFMSRAARYGAGDRGTFIAGERDRLTVIAMVEDAEALPHVGAIARTEGIDVIFVGPNDLATSLGHPGDVAHPDVVAAIAGIRRDVRVAGDLPLATTTSGGPLTAAPRIAADGFAMVCFSAVGLLMASLRDLRASLAHPA